MKTKLSWTFCLTIGLWGGSIGIFGMDKTPIDLSRVPVIQDEEAIHTFLEEVLNTQYCGEALEAGLGPETDLAGKSPVEGFGFAKVEENDWYPVAIRMAKADLQFLSALPETSDVLDTDAEKSEFALQQCLNAKVLHLTRLTGLLGSATNHSEETLDLLEAIAQTRVQGLSGSLVDNLGNHRLGYWRTWVQQSDLATEAGLDRCLDLIRKYVAANGWSSTGNFSFCLQWLSHGSKRCRTEEGYAKVARHVLASMEHFSEHRECYMLDCAAADGGLASWKGSLQRRQMAERFRNTTPPKVPRWNEAKQQEEMAIYEEMWPFMLSRRVAAELAADEKDLTDLREVYGEWPLEEQAAEASFP